MKKRGYSSSLFSNSRAQAAIFLVAAVVIVLAGVFYFFYQKQYAEKPVEIVQPEAAPVKSFVDNCLKNAAEDGLEKIGMGGGYINIPQTIVNDPRAYFTTLPGIGFKIPYWWHEGIESVPTLEFIQRQLELHVQTEIKNCVNKFEALHGRFEINELKEPIAEVQFNENDVSVSLAYQLEVIAKDKKFKTLIKNFNRIIPVRFKKVYEFAKLIMERENKDYFLERKTIDLFSINKEVPTTDFEASCRTKVWQLKNIKEEIKSMLRVDLPYIKIRGTDYNPEIYVPNPNGPNTYSNTYFQEHFVWDISPDAAQKYNNMKVAFTYDNWPMQVYARPSENGILKSNAQQGFDLMSFFCLHLWHFSYDINYPVIVSLSDLNPATNKEYHFSFPFKVNVNHNEPDRRSTGITLFETTADVSSDEFCNSLQNEITIFTVNNATGNDLTDVNLTFVCGRFYCDMGASNWLSLGAASGITKRFPFCNNGIIKGAKQGFAETKSFIQTNVDGRSYVLAMNPVKEFTNYKVITHLLSNPSSVQDIGPNEKASIMIKGKDNGYETYAVYPKDADFPLKLPESKDGTYEVTIYLVDGENIVGGYHGDWKITKDAVGSASEIVFHVLEQVAASDDDRFLFIAGLNSYSKKIPQPELK